MSLRARLVGDNVCTCLMCEGLDIFYYINNVGKTLLLGLPQKQNGLPTGYITLLSVISLLKRRVERYGLLMMAMLIGPLMGVKDPGKVRNSRVAKLRIVLIPILIHVKKFIPR